MATAALLAGGAAVAAAQRGGGDGEKGEGLRAAPPTAPVTTPTGTPSTRKPAPPRTPARKPPPRKAPATDPDPDPTAVPRTGPGTFTTAAADGSTHGTGTVHRYRVQVEDGTGIPPRSAAAEISAVLGHDRGWTRGGSHAFRQVGSTGTADFVVRIATPATVDRICGEYGLRTRGEVNCRAGTTVVVNLKRWLRGSPQFAGPIGQYRALIINHEVGHWLGRGHETCPGAGRPAPAMMQQIDGLKGCVANAWPYDADGTYLRGPSVP